MCFWSHVVSKVGRWKITWERYGLGTDSRSWVHPSLSHFTNTCLPSGLWVCKPRQLKLMFVASEQVSVRRGSAPQNPLLLWVELELQNHDMMRSDGPALTLDICLFSRSFTLRSVWTNPCRSGPIVCPSARTSLPLWVSPSWQPPQWQSCGWHLSNIQKDF